MLNLNFTPFPNLTTERLTLRQLNIEDANEIYLLRSDDRVNKLIDRPGSATIEEARTFIEKIEKGIIANDWVYWAITLKNHPALVGTIGYWNILPEHDLAEIGYELRPEFQGRGIMHEAILRVITFGFDEMKLRTITALPKDENKKSIQLLLNHNFQLNNEYKFVNKETASGLLVYFLSQNMRN